MGAARKLEPFTLHRRTLESFQVTPPAERLAEVLSFEHGYRELTPRGREAARLLGPAGELAVFFHSGAVVAQGNAAPLLALLAVMAGEIDADELDTLRLWRQGPDYWTHDPEAVRAYLHALGCWREWGKAGGPPSESRELTRFYLSSPRPQGAAPSACIRLLHNGAVLVGGDDPAPARRALDPLAELGRRAEPTAGAYLFDDLKGAA